MRQGGKGANVTVPFKLEALCAGNRADRARASGRRGQYLERSTATRYLGDNTDGVGLVTDIVRNAGIAMNGKRILLLGAGGAARGVILPLLE